MAEIRIRLIGNVAFENVMKLSEGFRCDIPVDETGIPRVPIARLLPASVVRGRHVGFAFPEGYLGIARQADKLVRLRRDIVPLVTACFTAKKRLPETGEWIRYLKAGQDFYASVEVGPDRAAFERALQSVSHIGICMEGISGEVECSLCEEAQGRPRWEQPSEGLIHDRLEYSVMPVAPLCVHAPYEDGPSTITYVPGMVFRDALEALCDDEMKARLRRMRFSNAYISDGHTRLLPLPLCMSLVKLDKRQLHYRLSPGKDPGRVEQDVGIGDAYARSFENRLTVYTKPETERITSRDGITVDALSCGQMFRGTVYGSDADLKALFALLKAHQHMALGSLTREGFGEVRIGAARLAEAEIGAEVLARRFDVSCLSHALILDSAGMQDTSAEGLLEEVERLLNAPGGLRIVDKYMGVYMDYSPDPRWKGDGMVSRCLAKGSVMRLETADGQPMDIAPLLHAFIGERTRDGYGEIMAYPARDGYYRAAEQRVPEKYGLEYPETYRSVNITMERFRRVLEMMLQKKIWSLAVVDQGDAQGREGAGSMLPLELLREIRDCFDPYVSDEKLIRWYLDGLKVASDGFVS